MNDIRHITGEIIERAADPGGDGRTVRIRMVRWETPSPTPEGYREAFAKGAFAGTDPSKVTIESMRHGGPLVGRGTEIDEADDAGYLTARIAKTPAGDELLTLIDEGVVNQASVAYRETEGGTRRQGDVLVRQKVDLWRVAVVERGVHEGAGVVSVRSSEGPKVEMIQDPAADVPEAAIMAAIRGVEERFVRMDTRFDDLITRAAIPAIAMPREGEEAGSLGELLIRAWDGGPGADLIKRALQDQIITDNAALVRPAFVADAVGIVSTGRPVITALGGAKSLPDSGMRLEWPVLTPLTGRAIGVQTAEKTEVVSVKISFTKAGADLLTYAGASDISIQLLRRSSPSYRDLFAQVMLAEYARVTEDAFVDAVIAGAGSSQDYVIAGDTDGSAFTSALFAASVKVMRATGAPATVAIVAEDVFVTMGGWDLIRPVNPQNAIGTGNARGLSLNISGVDVVLGTIDMPPGTIIVTNSRAASWYEDGPNTIQADDVAKLGLNVGYYGIAGTAIPIAAGIVLMYDVP